MTVWSLVIFVAWIVPGVWCNDSMHWESFDALTAACLSDEGCARRLSQELSGTNSTGNSTVNATGYKNAIHLVVSSSLPKQQVMQALADELQIDMMYIRENIDDARRLSTSYRFIIEVPPERDAQMFVQIIQAVDPAVFSVDSLSVVVTLVETLVVATPVVPSTMPLFDLTKRTTRVVELTRPGATVPITGDFIISNVVAVRGWMGMAPDVSATQTFSMWAVPYLMQAAMLAWDSGLIFDRPAVEANHTVQFVWVDQCADNVSKYDSAYCKMPYSMELLRDLYFGNAQTGLPQSKVVLGAHLFTEKLAYLASMQKTPMVGWYTGNPLLSVKDDYPNFMRVNAADVLFSRIGALVFSHFGFKTFDMFFCNDGEAQALQQMANEEFTADGYLTNAFIFDVFQYTFAPPGSILDAAAIFFGGRFGSNVSLAWEYSTGKKNSIDRTINAALAFNAHAHLHAISTNCNVADLMSYAQLMGLMGPGHFWSGLGVGFLSQYTGNWVTILLVKFSLMVNTQRVWDAGFPKGMGTPGGLNSDYRFTKPFDGGVWVSLSAPLASRPKYLEFEKLMKFLGANQAEYFEDDVVDKYPAAAFANLNSAMWKIAVTMRMIDGMLVSLYGINACVVKYGMKFTSEQLQEEMLKLDFDGITTRVHFDANGDVIEAAEAYNYVYPPNFTEQSIKPQGILYKVGTYDTELRWIKAPVFFDGRMEPPSDKDKPCGPGMVYERRTGDCLICPIGRYTSRVGQAFCDPCPPGTYSDVNGTKVCKPCGVGTFAMETGSTGCTACQAGMYADSVQMSDCKECWAGSSSAAGAGMCDLCPRGTYAEDKGRSQCTPCVGGKTTVNVASTSASACGCQEGTWFYAASPTAEGHCVSLHCADALECPGGNAEPIQGEGFHAGRPSYEHGMPSFFVACTSRGNCPRGRALGVCPAHRDAMACDLCEVGFSDDGQGGCTPCTEEGVGKVPLALATTFAGISAPVHCFFHLRPATVFSANSVTLALTVALGVNALQVANAISHVQMNWIEPMLSLREGLKWISFDVKVLKLQCISTTNSPAVMYLLGLLAFPMYSVYVWLILLVVQRCGRKEVTFNDVVNVVGAAMFTLNTGLCLQVAGAWQCETNPDGTTSAASAHSLLCYTSDGHRAMLGISVAGALAYLVAPLALTLWVVHKFPHQIVNIEGAKFFERYRFLIARFRPERYWYCTIHMCKSILCAVLPAWFVNDPPLVLMLFTLLIVGALVLQCTATPWRTTTANHFDAGTSMGLLWLIVAGATLLPAPGKGGQEMLQRCMMTVCIVFLVALGSIIISKLYARLFPKKVYGVFLSHHKGAAAVLSRWCKLMFQASTNRLIFLDSDELDDLSLLFNVVAWETANFVLLWTSQTVLRPWCAGEIVSAIEREVNTVVVLCEEVPRLTDEVIEQVGSTWTTLEIKCLVDLGITIEKIRQSYTMLRSLPSMKFDRTEGEAAQEATFSLIFGSCRDLVFAGTMARRLSSWWVSRHTTRLSAIVLMQIADAPAPTGGAGGVAIVADTCTVETRSVCYILRIMLQQKMQVVIDVLGQTPQQTEQVLSVAKHLLVVLTKGCLKKPSIANCLVKSHTYSQLTTVPVNADRTFEFPGDDFWEALENRSGEFNSVGFQGINNDELLIAYRSMLKMLALNLSPHASELILDAEMSQMVNRLTADKKVGAGRPLVTAPRAIGDQAIQAAPPATGSAPVMTPVVLMPQPVVVGAGTEDIQETYST